MADSLARMGRPPLKKDIGTKKTTIRLPEDLMARIQAAVEPNRMAEFFREAAERELKRRDKDNSDKR